MDGYSVVSVSFEVFVAHLARVLRRCKDCNLVLNLEKCHFKIKEEIVLDHENSKKGIKVEKSKVEVVENFPLPIFMKGNEDF